MRNELSDLGPASREAILKRRGLALVYFGLLVVFLTVLSVEVVAHPGATDANGCHADERGRIHCH